MEDVKDVRAMSPGSRSPSLTSHSRSRSRSPKRSRERSERGRERVRTRERQEGPVDEKLALYIQNLLEEKEGLDPKMYPTIHRLIANEINTITKRPTGVNVPDEGFIDLYNDAPISLNVKALPPAKVYPKFNYAGRIIGPKGVYLKSLMKETMCKMVLLGKGVMKDKEKELALKESSDPKYFHLHDDMHVAIHVTAPASEAYARIAYAISCLKKQVLSDNRTLETLPWIAHANRVLEGRSTMQSTRQPSPPYRPSRPPPTYSSYSPREDYPPIPKAYIERSTQKYRQYTREESPPPSRALDYAAHTSTSRSFSGHHSSRRSPVPHSHGYDYPYAPPLEDSRSYGGGRGSYDSTSGWQRTKGWDPESPRYAPYKKT